VFVLLPIYLAQLHISKSMIGIIYAVESSIDIILFPLMGKFCDQSVKGSVFLIILGFIASAFKLFLYTICYIPIHFIIAQFFAAISWTAFVVGAVTFTGKVSPYEKRGEAMGIVESSSYLGGLAGPIITSLFSKIWDFRTTIQIFIIFPVLSALISLLKLKLKTPLSTEEDKDFIRKGIN